MSAGIPLRLCLLSCLIVLGSAVAASSQPLRRVPAEFEPQDSVWLQWPGRFEKAYEPAYAEISNVIVQYETLHILHDTSRVRDDARAAITSAGGDPDHVNIVWHSISNENAWMRDNGPVYAVQDGQMRIQDWEFDAWGGAFGNIPYANDNAVPVEVGSVLSMPVDHVDIVHERGNLEFNGVDTVVLNWNVIGNPNRGNGYANKAEAEVDLKNWFGVTKVIWADGPITGDDTGGHIDGIARFIDANRVVVGNCTVNGHCQPGDSDDLVYDGVASDLAAAGFEVIRMDFDAAVTYRGFTFDTDYMNWGVGNGWVILVGFDNPATDNAAKAQLEQWFPGRDVYVIEMLDSWIAGGGVHCHTNDQPATSTIGTAPTADFAAAETVGPAPFEAHFTDLSTEDPSAWEWTFGDGGTSTDQNPVHTYSAEGLHTVSLTARSASGSDTAVYSDLIAVPEPAVWLQLVSGCLGLWVISARCRKRHSSGRFAELVLKVVIVLFTAVTAAHAVSTETSNGCSGTQDDPCIRSGSCEIQGAVWTQDVTIDRADTFDTQGWPGLCDMVHVGLVQGNCEPAGAQTDVTVHLSANSFAWVPSIVGPLACAGEPQPVPAFGAIGRLLLGGLLLLVGLVRTRPFSA